MTMDKHSKATKLDVGMPLKYRTMPAGEFKAKCLEVMDQVQAKSESIVITKRGKPVARLVPVDPATDDFYGFMRGKVTILGDIVRPVTLPGDWGSE